MIRRLNLAELQAQSDDATYEGDEHQVDAGDEDMEVTPKARKPRRTRLQKLGARVGKDINKMGKSFNKGTKVRAAGFNKIGSAWENKKKEIDRHNARMKKIRQQNRQGWGKVVWGAGRSLISPIYEEPLNEAQLLELGINDYDLDTYNYYLAEKRSHTAQKVGKMIDDVAHVVVKAVKDDIHDAVKNVKSGAKESYGNARKSLKIAGKKIRKEAGAWNKDAKSFKKGVRTLTSPKRFNAAAKKRQKSGYDDETKGKIKAMKAEDKAKRKLKEDIDYTTQDFQPNLAMAVQAAIAGQPGEFQGLVQDTLKAKALDYLDQYKEFVADNMFNDNEDEDYDDEEELNEEDFEIVAELDEGPEDEEDGEGDFEDDDEDDEEGDFEDEEEFLPYDAEEETND